LVFFVGCSARRMKVSVVVAVLVAAYVVEAVNNRPIIGILDQRWDEENEDNRTYVAASYVKWVESAGARAIPLFYDAWSVEEMQSMLKNINGVIFPGGGAEFKGKYLAQLQTIFNFAKQSTDNGVYFPLWGTCLGFEELICLGANDTSVLDGPFDCADVNLALTLAPAASQSKLFQAMPDNLKQIITTQKVAYNYHEFGITPKHFNNLPLLVDFYNVLSTNEDMKGTPFISTIEAKKYPIYGTQWHPEIAVFEWVLKSEHSTDSIEVNSWMGRFFVNECRKNDNHFSDATAEKKALFYQYDPTYTGDLFPPFMQSYFFNDK